MPTDPNVTGQDTKPLTGPEILALAEKPPEEVRDRLQAITSPWIARGIRAGLSSGIGILAAWGVSAAVTGPLAIAAVPLVTMALQSAGKQLREKVTPLEKPPWGWIPGPLWAGFRKAVPYLPL